MIDENGVGVAFCASHQLVYWRKRASILSGARLISGPPGNSKAIFSAAMMSGGIA